MIRPRIRSHGWVAALGRVASIRAIGPQMLASTWPPTKVKALKALSPSGAIKVGGTSRPSPRGRGSPS